MLQQQLVESSMLSVPCIVRTRREQAFGSHLGHARQIQKH